MRLNSLLSHIKVTLILLSLYGLLASSLQASTYSSVYSFESTPRLASSDRLEGRPFKHHPLPWVLTNDAMDLSNLIILPLFSIAGPLGSWSLGSVLIWENTHNLIKEVHHLNKLGKEWTEMKALPLTLYMGLDGLSLFPFYLRHSQSVKTAEGKVENYSILNHLGQRRAGVDIFKIRDFTNHFIVEWQKKKSGGGPQLIPPEGKEYLDHLNKFARELGIISFSTSTIEHVRRFIGPWAKKSDVEIERFLYDLLAKQKILNRDGALRHLRFRQRMTSQKIIMLLKREGIEEIHLVNAILHDLGFVTPTDLDLIKEKLMTLINSSQTINSALQEDLNLKKERLFKHLSILTDQYYQKEKDLVKAVDRLIMKTVVNKGEFKEYRHKNGLLSPSQKSDDYLMGLKLAYLDRFDVGRYHFLQLEEDLQKIRSMIVLLLQEQKVQNGHFAIMQLKGENLVLNGITYIGGLGFLTLGTLGLILNFPMAVQALPLATPFSNHLSFISSMSLFFGTNIGIIQTIRELFQIKVALVTRKLLDDHLQKVEKIIDESKNESIQDEKEALQKFRFSAIASSIVQKAEHRHLIRLLHLKATWFGYGMSAIVLWTYLILVLAGVSLSVGAVVGIGFATNLFSGLLAIPGMYFTVREYETRKRAQLLRGAYEDFQEKIDTNKLEQLDKQEQFFKLFLLGNQPVLEMIASIFDLQFNVEKLGKRKDLLGLEKSMVRMHKARRLFIENWKQLEKSSEEAQKGLQSAVEKQLLLEKSELSYEELMKYARPSSFKNSVDLLIEAIDPTKNGPMSFNIKDSLSPSFLPLDKQFWAEQHLSNLFSMVFFIWNDYQDTCFEYQFMFNKQELQLEHFNHPLTIRERNRLKNSIAERIAQIDKIIYQKDLNIELESIYEIYTPHLGGKLISWKDSVRDELNILYEELKRLHQMADFVDRPLPKYEKIKSSNLPFLNELLSLVLPLDRVSF